MANSGCANPGRVRVLRVIARMNVGGPAYNVAILTGRLDPERYETLLVHGRLGPGEGSFEQLARDEGCRVRRVEELSPTVRPLADLRALLKLIRIVRTFRPDIVHTHTAKAGFIGRAAAFLGRRPRPVIVHTYHGHVLEGYFGPVKTGFYRFLERMFGRVSDCLIGVSQATIDDLVRLRVAPRERFRRLSIGLDLSRFAQAARSTGEEFRVAISVPSDCVLLLYTGRLVPIKRVDLLLVALAKIRASGASVHLAVIGDGELRTDLEGAAKTLGVDDHVSFVGYLADTVPATAASDVAVLASDNEGTPVALIEAAAAALPSVATRVGGVPEVVTEHAGRLVAPGDASAIAAVVLELVSNPLLRREMGKRAQYHVNEQFSSTRLLRDVEKMYEELLLLPSLER